MQEEPPAAAWLAEALETGNPLAPLPASIAPATIEAGEAIALAVAGRLGLSVCGVRIAPGPGGGWLAGPLVETRMLRDGATLTLAALRHARARPALLAILGAELRPGEETAPAIAALHPAIDVGAWRFRDPPGLDALAASDLAGHGQVVVGRARTAAPLPEGVVAASLAPDGRRPIAADRGACDLGAALAEAAAAARRLGGLPEGAGLLLAGFGPVLEPRPGQRLVARFGALGRVAAGFA